MPTVLYSHYPFPRPSPAAGVPPAQGFVTIRMRGLTRALFVGLLCCGLTAGSEAASRPRTHLVRRGDTLSGIAARYGLSQEQLRQWNRLTGDRVLTGQRLRLTAPPSRGEWHVVRQGENLTRLARRYRLEPEELRRLNALKTDVLQPGQRLRLRPAAKAPEPVATVPYQVQPGESLSLIAQRHQTSVAMLRVLNDLKGNLLQAGATIQVPASGRPEEPAAPEEYRVRPGDSLSRIAARFEVGLPLLRQLNRLTTDVLQPGQTLRLRPGQLEEGVHVVRQGETLSGVARRYGLTVEALRELNGLEGSRILVGQKLRLKDAAATTHLVERGDALWEIARAYGMSIQELRDLNGMTTDRIYAGQELKVSSTGAGRYEIYTVKAGDHLTQIARLHQMSVAELKKVNGLRRQVIHPGEQLKVRPLLGGDSSTPVVEAPRELLPADLTRMPLLPSENGPYYYTRPDAPQQPSKGYFENHPASPLENYRQARRLFDAFSAAVDSLERLSDDLEGWHVVLDPGHGGLDPGAVVASPDDDGRSLYVVEDEYMYDVALRVFVLLRLHGARVTLTVLSPNHLIRNVAPPSRTFVNQKNEVYNSQTINRSDNLRAWPRGGNLNQRVRIAREALAKAPVGKRLFLSFHGDIDPHSPEAPLVLYYQSKDGRRRDAASRAFAQSFLPALGAGAYTRGQALGVLRDNPADVKVLLELRNMAYRDHLWALRFDQLRHRDAEKVVKGVLDWVHGQGVSLHP